MDSTWVGVTAIREWQLFESKTARLSFLSSPLGSLVDSFVALLTTHYYHLSLTTTTVTLTDAIGRHARRNYGCERD